MSQTHVTRPRWRRPRLQGLRPAASARRPLATVAVLALVLAAVAVLGLPMRGDASGPDGRGDAGEPAAPMLHGGSDPSGMAGTGAEATTSAGVGQYGPPEWLPLRTDLAGNGLQVGCTYLSQNGCGGHHGYWALDLGLGATGAPVHAAGAGKVIEAGYQAGWGNYVRVDHDGFGDTLYAHLLTISVSVNDWVDQTTQLGSIGATGSASVSHLHFEYYDLLDAGSDDPGDLKACHGGSLVTYGNWASVVPYTQYIWSDGTTCGFTLPDVTTRFQPIQPARILDSRPGDTNIGPYATPWGGGEAATRDINVAGQGGVPADAVAAVLNVTVVDPTAPSFLQLWPKGAPRPGYGSSLNFGTGQVVANAVTVRIGDHGQVRIMNAVGSVDVVVDVAGYYRAGDGAGFVPLTPSRLLDSRGGTTNVGPYAAPWPEGSPGIREVPVGGRGGVPADAVAVVLNVTAVNPSDTSFLQIWPTGSAQPTFGSSVNFRAGQIVPNAVTVKLGAGGAISVMNAVGVVDVVVDVTGYYTATGGADFHPVQPDRALDSRSGASNVGSYRTPWGPSTVRAVQIAGRAGVPGGAQAVVLNVTAVEPTAATFVQLWPVGVGQPALGSSLNAEAGQVVPNAVTVGLGFEGDVMAFNAAGSVDLVADVAGWFG